jgi:Transglutaminase-like superfamily
MQNPQEYYREHGPMTTPGANAAEFKKLPKDLAALCEVIQGVLIHRDMCPFLYNLNLSKEQRDEANIRPLAQMLTQIHELDPRPLTAPRKPAGRLKGVCWHFSEMLAGILQTQGVPARARCGFGAYFNEGKFEDHWVCEYWNAAEKRWILVDAQLDALQKKQFKPDFSTLDVPRDQFVIAGDAWQRCRAGRADPKDYGLSMIPELHGMWFIAGNVVRDFASLNRAPMLPWDVWGLMEMKDDALTEEKKKLLDRVAELTLAGDEAFPEIRKIYESDERLRVPPVVFNVDRQTSESVATS